MYATTSNRKSEQPYPFLTEIADIRRRTREHIERAANNPSIAGDEGEASEAGDREVVLRLLNEALATEIICVMRYRQHGLMALGAMGGAVQAQFLKHSQEEQLHVDQIAQRIVQLGGTPELRPPGIVDRSHAEYEEGDTCIDLLEEDLIAERIAIQSYQEMVHYLADRDPITRGLMQAILVVEGEHAEELVRLRDDMLRRERVDVRERVDGRDAAPGRLASSDTSAASAATAY